MIKDEENFVKAPEASDENKVVYQLDEITEDSELKTEEIFNYLEKIVENLDSIKDDIENNISQDEIISNLENTKNYVFEIMSIMQFQDIHRQKIDRVIGVMRNLSKYMGHLLDRKVDNSKREHLEPKHIAGDNNETMDDEDIENLIKSFKLD